MSTRQHTPRQRVSHVIRPNHGTFVPGERVYVDCEALRTRLPWGRERQSLWFGWACYERVRTDTVTDAPTEDWLRFTEPVAFWRWVTGHVRSHQRLIVYAHNLGYDAALLCLATNAAATGWEMVDYVTSTHLMWVEFKRGEESILFLDTLNYFGVSLRSLGESIGIAKETMPAVSGSTASWDVYCKQDVAVLREAMHQYFAFIETEDMGHYQRTLASQAYTAWRHRFMQHRVVIIASDALSALERRAYHGGRTEVFYDRELVGTTYGLDINAMYPAMMSRNTYPIRVDKRGSSLALCELERMLAWGCVVADVTLRTDEPCYPYRSRERIIFPVGRFDTTLSTRELRYALGHGHIERIGQYALYEDATCLREYAVTLFKQRQRYKDAGNPAFAYMCKIMNNALYGKFGQRGTRWLNCADPLPDGVFEAIGECDPDLGPLTHRQRFGVWQHQIRDLEAFESFPAIAAHITADARMRLWQLITLAGREHVFYCDTDSIYCDSVGYQRLSGELDARMLGALKEEGTYDTVHFRAPKDYRLGPKSRVKGVRATAHAVRDGYYQQEQFESYDQVLARGDDGYIMVHRIAKRITRVNQQSVGENVGWREPIRLGGE